MYKYTVTKILSHEYKLVPNLIIIHGNTQTRYGPCLLAVAIISDQEKLCFVYFSDDYNLGFKELKHIYYLAKFIRDDKIIAEKNNYFKLNETGLIIPLLIKGTNFEISVWEYLLSIPRGSTISYEEVAKGINNPKACRAVANAISKNNIAFFIPCHRVISKNGNLNKYRWGEEMKKLILSEEKILIN